MDFELGKRIWCKKGLASTRHEPIIVVTDTPHSFVDNFRSLSNDHSFNVLLKTKCQFIIEIIFIYERVVIL